jgi:ATP phosphoribosyltransferase
MSATAILLQEIGLGFKDYKDKTRQYRLKSELFPRLDAKIFQEKDIPVQVSIGNYDLGICGLDWIEELTARYPASDLLKIASLGYGEGNIYLSTSYQSDVAASDDLKTRQFNWCIASEYPNLAQAFALQMRLRSFKVFPVWGASEAYPPENADLALVWAINKEILEGYGLIPLKELISSTAYLIGNRKSLEDKELSQILTCFNRKFFSKPKISTQETMKIKRPVISLSSWQAKDIKMALPDGHQQKPTSQLLVKAGFNVKGYSEIISRRPDTEFEWLGIKVIRPQDMPLQVANGNFDLAITGMDWLSEHLYRYPASPVVKLLDLRFGGVKIVAAVSQAMQVNSVADLRLFCRNKKYDTLRVASEYINTADKYLRENHIHPYKLIPTWGASEAFLPDDADLLIDNTQTGRTLEKHKLKIIDVLFESTACLIGNRDKINLPGKKERVEFLTKLLKTGLSC